MDSEADLVMEDQPILGKRKRSLTLHRDSTVDHEEPVLPDASRQERSRIGQTGLDSKKLRLASDMPMENQVDDNEFVKGQSSSPYGTLPPQVLQRIFCHVEPFQLARLMSVNRGFRALLDQRHPLPRDDGEGQARLMLQDSIWSISRKTFMPDLPNPLLSVREYDMLKLMYGHTCDYCGRPSRSSLRTAITPWNAGPGQVGVRAIWPFKVKSCGECLKSRIVEEQALMMTSASAMQPGLPFVLFTPSLSYVTSLTMGNHAKPPGLKLAKYYFRPQIDQLEQRRDEIREERPEALAEWYRTLGSSLKTFEADWIRLEQWEEASRAVPVEYVPPDSASGSSSHAPRGSKVHSATPSLLTSTSHSAWRYRKPSQQQPQAQSAAHKSHPTNQISLETHHPAMVQHNPFPYPPSVAHSHQSSSTIGPAQPYTGTGVKNVLHTGDGNSIRVDDGRGLGVPFQFREPDSIIASRAPTHMTRSLAESDQSTLRDDRLVERPRLVPRTTTGRDDQASFVSRETILNDDPGPDFSDVRVLMTYAQRPTRDKLYDAAKEYIRRIWVGGTGLVEATAPQFAADVLMHVRQRFYQVQDQEDAALALSGHPPPSDTESGIRTRKLRLEHMKHVFEECIRPYTELVTKDLFLCSSCGTQGKYFAFEAMIQHFAAKHTKEFSRGNVIVSWKADWPAEPPFDPRPGGDVVSQIRASPPVAVRHSGDVGEAPRYAQHSPSIESRTITQGDTQREAYQDSPHPGPPVLREYIRATQSGLPEIIPNTQRATVFPYQPQYRDSEIGIRFCRDRRIHVQEVPAPDNATSIGPAGYPLHILQSRDHIPIHRMRQEQGRHRPSDPEYMRTQYGYRSAYEHDHSMVSSRQMHLDLNVHTHDQQFAAAGPVRFPSSRSETPHGANAAHEFLESFTPMLVDHADDQLSAPSSVARLSRPQSRDLRLTPGIAIDRRSNMSLPRKQSPPNSVDEIEQQPEESSIERCHVDEIREPLGDEAQYYLVDRDRRPLSPPRTIVENPVRRYSPQYEQARRMMTYPDDGYATYIESQHQMPAYGRPLDPPSPEPVRYRPVYDMGDRRMYDGGYYDRSDRLYEQPPPRVQVWNSEPPRQFYPNDRPVGIEYAQHQPPPPPPPPPPPLPLSYRGRGQDMYRMIPEYFEQDGRLYERVPDPQYPPDQGYPGNH